MIIHIHRVLSHPLNKLNSQKLYGQLDGVPVPERVKTATRQMSICHF